MDNDVSYSSHSVNCKISLITPKPTNIHMANCGLSLTYAVPAAAVAPAFIISNNRLTAGGTGEKYFSFSLFIMVK